VPLATNSFIVPGNATLERAPTKSEATSTTRRAEPDRKIPLTRETWGHLSSLPDHFERYGSDFKAKDPDDYARMAWEFQQPAKGEGLLIKLDSGGVTRIYDPKSGALDAHNRNGTSKTFFKPNSRDYFECQPGELVRPNGRN
jgi:pyocin large subunit-like protein